VDLGLYYRPPLDVVAPWVDGGGWIDIEGTAVDWI
jgi:hypothetical protein